MASAARGEIAAVFASVQIRPIRCLFLLLCVAYFSGRIAVRRASAQQAPDSSASLLTDFRCPALNSADLDQFIALEWSPPSETRELLLTVTCDERAVRLRIELTREHVAIERDILRSDLPASAAERLLAVTASEMAVALTRWNSEAATKGAIDEKKSPQSGTTTARSGDTNLAAAKASRSRNRSQVRAAAGDDSLPRGLQISAQVRSEWIVGGLSLLGGGVGAGLRLRANRRVQLRLISLAGEQTTTLGDISCRANELVLFADQTIRTRSPTFRVGAGVRFGRATLSGTSSDVTVTTGSSFSALFGGPFAELGIGLRSGAFEFDLSGQLGALPISAIAASSGEGDVVLGGVFGALNVTIGFQP